MGVSIRIAVVGIVVCALLQARVSAQALTPAEDSKTQSLYILGEKHMRAKSYAEAVLAFDEAQRRPFNKLTTSAIYMAGLAAYHAGQYERALEQFQKIIQGFGKSNFIPEATYHKALVMLKQPEKREGGLYVLLNLIEQTRNEVVKEEATKALHYFLFKEAELEFLKAYADRVRQAYKPLVVEALCLQLYKKSLLKELDERIAKYESEAPLTSRLQKLKLDRTRFAKPTEMRIAVMLPFMATRQDSAMSVQTQVCLQLLAGIQLALETDSVQQLKKVQLLILDTEGDTAKIDKQLREQVASYKPDVIIGDFKNRPALKIAAWAERNQTVQIVPLSGAEELIAKKQNVFLANPTGYTAGREMGRAAAEKFSHRRIMIVYDETRASERMADGFTDGVAAHDFVFVFRRRISSSPEIAMHNLDEVSHHLDEVYYHTVFMPLVNEEVVGYGLFAFSRDSIDTRTQVFGMDAWRSYRGLDRESLQRYAAVVNDSYYQENDLRKAGWFERAYLTKYQAHPTIYAAQGYDIGRWMVQAYSRYGAANKQDSRPGDFLHRMPPFRGVNQDYYFGKANDNQRVRMIQYQSGGEEVPLRIW